MTTDEILKALDGQIARLQEARVLLSSVESQARESTSGVKGAALRAMLGNSDATPVRRSISPEGRARIAAAQRERWAKRALAAKSPKKSRSTPAKSSMVSKSVAKKKSSSTASPSKTKSASKKSPTGEATT